ncbi:SO_0444 family Cu/Zn efflux transporter [Echinimonas agarilytica]|uniref:SO_0444 family Cu/Zn efflux transporter n=1 Tax=Echinimonas agarilytica TaxID=1215918 RepID=A0AA41W8J6_9GAMM|nr:SO_0444 family Cu/Zn efflux transporter [Echinimonas agarilytica]MCM2680478.1 SO_0444 family Cu/Zn efflux transporter [Echinimonas agarilytica]
MEFLNHLLSLSLDAAPYLLLGLVIAGLIKAFLPESWVRQQLAGKGSVPVAKAALLGAPMPLCSCSVIPVALGIRRNGASKGSTVSFLISTPETGVDSISLTYAMMGPVMAIVRPVAAVLTALSAGIWVNKTESEQTVASSSTSSHGHSHHSSNTSCCASKTEAKEPPTSSCCSPKNASGRTQSKTHKALSGIQYAFGQLFDDILLWLAVGLLIAAAVQTFVPTEWLATWGSGWVAKGIMLVIGIPMYICASASTPIAAGLMLAGVSPGTVLVFLLAGPATNVSTIAVLRNELGNSVMWKYIITVMLGALLSGVLLDSMLADGALDLVEQQHAHAALLPMWLSTLSLGILLLSTIKPIRTAVFASLEHTK